MNKQEQKERRKYKRYPYRENIIIDETIPCTSIDISEGGMYVYAIQPLAENSLINITIPYKEKKLTVRAQVRYSQPGIGMGIMFIDLTDMQKRIIKQIIETLTQPEKPEEKSKKILLVEDNDNIRQKHKNELTVEGLTVIEASDGIEAIKILAEEIPDLVILDLFMEKMDGFKVLSILKIHPTWKDIPVIVFSSHSTKDVMKKVIDAGAEEFLNKIVTSPSKLAEVAKTVLLRHHKAV